MEFSCNLAEVYIDDALIDEVHNEGEIEVQHLDLQLTVNQYVLLRGLLDEKKTALCKMTSRETLKKIKDTKSVDLLGISPKDSKQACLVDALSDSSILLTCAIGPAGTGKSTIAVAYGLSKAFKEKKKLYMSKSTALVGRGRTFGAVPGDVREKYAPHVSSYQIILKKLLGDKSDSYIKLLEEKGQIEYIPIEYARGATFEDCTFIIDEVQNLSWHELKTICSRMSDTTNLILLGDLEQIDLNVNQENVGIYKLLCSKSFKASEITAQIHLDVQYRGPIPTLMSDVDKELKGN